jgi:3-mercaptopyruvate sulfurtransferase SseA
VALFLTRQGYRAFALKGGYQAWRNARYPMESKEVETITKPSDICPECGLPMSAHLPPA